MGLSSIARLTHPRTAGVRAQLAVVLAAVLLGLGLASILMFADGRSWRGATTTTATVTGLQKNGIHAQALGKDVVLHLEHIPRDGTRIAVEVSPDGRARPTTYRQTWYHAIRSSVLLFLGLAVVLQVYRFAVTRRQPA